MHAAQGATVDVARVVAGAGQVDTAEVYVPMTRGRITNHLYLAEAMPGDTEAGHGDITPTVRRETADYARDLPVQAATRDRGDVTPYEVHRQARLDWTISRISQNLLAGADPFVGTRIAEVPPRAAGYGWSVWGASTTPKPGFCRAPRARGDAFTAGPRLRARRHLGGAQPRGEDHPPRHRRRRAQGHPRRACRPARSHP